MNVKFGLMATLIMVPFVFSACTTAPAVSKTASKVPPRLVQDKGADGKIHPNNLAWDRIDAFGPVPAQLQQKGNMTCRAVNFKRAAGYHPAAQDVNGNTIPGGAFLCSY